jgi:hypothetical protein
MIKAHFQCSGTVLWLGMPITDQILTLTSTGYFSTRKMYKKNPAL